MTAKVIPFPKRPAPKDYGLLALVFGGRGLTEAQRARFAEFLLRPVPK